MNDRQVAKTPGLIESRIDDFKRALTLDSDDGNVVRSQILHGASYAIQEDEAYKIAEAVGNHWGVHPNQDIYFVGSAKMGFSISPNKRWKRFGNTSDLDIAVVSSQLFEQYWYSIEKYAATVSSWPDRQEYMARVASGWLRPDLFPGSMADEWFEFFREVQNKQRYAGGIKIAAGVYYNMSFLELYQSRAVKLCRGSER